MAHIPPATCIPVSFLVQIWDEAHPVFRSFAGAAAAGTAQPIFVLYLKASTHPKYTIA
jgi:hypothetical protein